MISEQSLEGWDNKPVKFSNVKYPQTKDDNAPQNFFLAIFCGSRGSGETYLLTKLLKLLEPAPFDVSWIVGSGSGTYNNNDNCTISHAAFRN